jgi:type VI protein secretion system component VasF
MNMPDVDEALLRRLSGLRVMEPDAARIERVRERCSAALLQRRQQAERQTKRDRFTARVLEPLFVGTLSASYLLAILFVLLRLHGFI